jgi:ATP-dependent Clp protease ATP-binding subunit ClpX
MLDVMYELPSGKDVANCLITPEMVEKRSTAELLWHPAWHKQHETA